jgi:tetratricopeptide (TPR) repeat protein
MDFGLRKALAAGAAASIFLLAAQAATPVAAMGGGGGDMPSSSTPAYDPGAEYAKGVAALNAGQYKDAEKSLSRVASAAPTAEVWRMIGQANAGQSDLKGARKAYERAVKLEPDNLAAHQGLGLALAGLKDPKAQAELDWLTEKAKACNETCADAAALKSAIEAVQAAMGAPKPSAALEPGALIFATPQAGDSAYLSAVSLINERRYDDALAALDAARLAFGPHPDVLTYQGYAWRKKGDWTRAETYYRQALAVAPAHRGALEYYGELKVERGDMKGARRLLARLDRACDFGCPEAEELRRWIIAGRAPGA